MPVHDDLGTRMKSFYEAIPQTKLMRRTPVAIRLDGKAFHTFTKGFKRPYDEILIKTMQQTMKYLCENIQGCVLGYTQSDEITLILVDYKNLDSNAWFDYKVQKVCSISASMATFAFNEFFWDNIPAGSEDEGIYQMARERGAMFDSRCFNIPREEVTNLLYWRQLDAARNSIQMLGQFYYSHKQLDKKTIKDIQNMVFTDYGINWNDFPAFLKRGSCCVKVDYWVDPETGEQISEINPKAVKRTKWTVDLHIPMFKEEHRNYIEDLI